MGRYEVENNMLAIDYSHFSNWLSANQAGAKETMKKISANMDTFIIPKYNFTKGVSGLPMIRKKALILNNYVDDDKDLN